VIEPEYEHYTLQIVWQSGYLSPFVGVFESQSSARRYATQLRRMMRENSKRFKQVRVLRIVPPNYAEFWIRPDSVEIEDEARYHASY
jgi:pyridoxine/pyridoxamine 5'-phosphate oxidase